MTYVELQVTSNFSFLRGASHAEELAETAAALGHRVIGLSDRNTLAGVVRAHRAAKATGIRALTGCRLDLEDGMSVLCYPKTRAAYGRLSRLLTLGKRRGPRTPKEDKRECHIARDDLFLHGDGQVVIALVPESTTDTPVPVPGPDSSFGGWLRDLKKRFGENAYLAAQALYRGDDTGRLARLARLAEACGTPLVATNDVHYHVPARRPLQDALSCIREHCTIETAGRRLLAHAERHLKSADEMARLFRDYPDAVARTAAIAETCTFSLDELRYEYPAETAALAGPPQQELERLTWAGAEDRYPEGVPETVRATLDHELRLIDELGYAPYFLTVHDIVRYARSRRILCQGRGSAANSAVCYCLGITAVDPGRIDLLFERFVSAERGEPPDIDVDFEHERREEVIQYIYEKYGRHRAGMTATVISYRWRSAIREIVKALGLSEDVGGALAGYAWGSPRKAIDLDQVREIGLDPADRRLALALKLAGELVGFPRHLSQHPGGFVITRGPLSEVVPIANAAMEDRTMIEWNKDDIDALGILKIDVLGLGILTCIRKSFDLLARHYRRTVTLATVPAEDGAVYNMLCRGDSVGVFQVESRAQMTMLPRLKPRSFYDLVIEVAIVRPGPIQGDMVHPYLRRRRGEEEIDFPSEDLRGVLGKTLGVPLFQEQAMKIAIVAAGFSPAEADGLRRAMATFRHTGTIHSYRERFVGGMVERGYGEDFATRCFHQIEGFGEYGFPESHAASFALLVYVSAWLKCHYPAVFACALLNSQPMGFYAPAQIVRDAQDHGATVRPVDVNFSDWDCTLEAAAEGGGAPPKASPPRGRGLRLDRGASGAAQANRTRGRVSGAEVAGEAAPAMALRLGLRQIKGFREEDAEALMAACKARFRTVPDLWRRAGLSGPALERLAGADAFASVGLRRRAALWAVRGLGDSPLPLFAAADAAEAPEPKKTARAETAPRRDATDAADAADLRREPVVTLPDMAIGEEVISDYSALRLSLKRHPLDLLRPRLTAARAVPAAHLKTLQTGAQATVAGLVICRQRPGTASGVIFMTLEDETGVANIVAWPRMFERYRKTVLRSRLLTVAGKVEREGLVVHVIADHLEDMSATLLELADENFVPRDQAMPAQKWGTANADSINLTRVLAGRRPHRTAPAWTGRIDEAARGDPAGGRGHPIPEPKRVWPGDADRTLRRDFSSRDFH